MCAYWYWYWYIYGYGSDVGGEHTDTGWSHKSCNAFLKQETKTHHSPPPGILSCYTDNIRTSQIHIYNLREIYQIHIYKFVSN
jgi:hypothetical protein